MSIRKIIITMTVLSLAVLLAAPAMAQTGFGIGPRIGYAKASDAEDGAFFVGADANFRFLDGLLGVRGEVGWHRDTFTVLNHDFDVDTVPLLASLTVYPFRNFVLSPYAIAGAGWYFVTVSSNFAGQNWDETDNAFGWHIGGGVELSLGEHFVINADFRYVAFEVEIGDAFKSDGDGVLGTAGTTFYF